MGNKNFGTALTILFVMAVMGLAAPLPTTVTFTNFFGNQVTFQNPLYFSEMPGKPGYYVVLEQYLGQVSVVHKENGTWVKTVMDTVTLGPDVTAQNEMGLLGIAFHPDYATTHKYYLTYNPTTAATWLVARQADTSLIRRDTTVASVHFLTINKPYTNHNGGTIGFSPKDTGSYLYFGTGDGGGTNGDSLNRAQSPDSLQGKFLRIDVDHPANGKPYGIPADNPFIDSADYAPEIFSLGERNPWKWSFDPVTGIMWLGHVGQDLWEAATVVPKGSNLGWHVVEGGHCYDPATGCSMAGYQMPFTSYEHGASTLFTGYCVIGGYVYRGNPNSPFYGVYFMGDNNNGKVWAVKTDGVSVQDSALEGTVSNLTSFGTDLAGNLYAVSRDGPIYALGGPDLVPSAISQFAKSTRQNFANTTLTSPGALLPTNLFGSYIYANLYSLAGRRVAIIERNNAIVPKDMKAGMYILKTAGNNLKPSLLVVQ